MLLRPFWHSTGETGRLFTLKCTSRYKAQNTVILSTIPCSPLRLTQCRQRTVSLHTCLPNTEYAECRKHSSNNRRPERQSLRGINTKTATQHITALSLDRPQQCRPVKEPNILIYFFFRPSLNAVLFPMFCLLVEGEYQILVF